MQGRLAEANAELQDLEETASTVCCFCLWNNLKTLEAKQKPLLSSPASSAADLWASVKCEDVLKGVRESFWALAAEPKCPAAPGSIFGQRLCGSWVYGERCPPLLSLWVFWLPALFAASEAGLTIFDGTNHSEALKKIWITDPVEWGVFKETLLSLFFMQSSKDRNTFYSGSSQYHKNSCYILKAFKSPQSNGKRKWQRFSSTPGEKSPWKNGLPRIDPSEPLDLSSNNDLKFLLHLIIIYQANLVAFSFI